MNVCTMGRSRAGGLRTAAISIAAAISIGAATLMTASAQSFEVPSNRQASQILPANLISGPYHRVRETVVSYGYMYHYTVDSQFGVFEATGDPPVRHLIWARPMRLNTFSRLITGTPRPGTLCLAQNPARFR